MAKNTNQEELQERVAAAVGAGRELHLETVDFSDPNRPRTCIEHDYPIIPINTISSIEASSGAATKPVYQMSKWWARRQSSVFRSILIASATKAPDDSADAAKLVWDSYYANHKNNKAYRHLKVADIFMGGGTTIVEGSRLGMQMHGNDLNPVAWFVVKNELAQVDPQDITTLLDSIEATVKSQIMPFYACNCPRGHKGKWTRTSTGEVMNEHFDPLSLTQEERLDFSYDGPEIIYTFWAKHGPCQSTECDHRTPIMPNPIIASRTGSKALTVKAWQKRPCGQCDELFDIEQKDVRLAPSAALVVADGEFPYATMTAEGAYECPHCHEMFHDENAASTGKSARLGKAQNKKIALTLLVHPQWMSGTPGFDENGQEYGGRASDDAESTARWNDERTRHLRLVEVRGTLPDEIPCPDITTKCFTDNRGGTIPKKSTFTCQETTCGLEQGVLESVKQSGDTGPISMYAVQGYCPSCANARMPGSGRFYTVPDPKGYAAAHKEWESNKSGSLQGFWPSSELSLGWKTHGWAIPEHGYTHYWKMFNSRQLLIHSLLLKAIVALPASDDVLDLILGSFLHFLRCNCAFTIWHLRNSQISAFLSNNSYQAKNTVVETSVFSPVGDGSWMSATRGLLSGLEWQSKPWEIVANSHLEALLNNDDANSLTGKTTKVNPCDTVQQAQLVCGSANSLALEDESVDLVITDPPFGEIMQYAELSDFFYVWLTLVLADKYPEQFGVEYTPKALEVVTNPFRNEEPEGFYQRLLTACWQEAARTMKPGGLLVFTFHHEKDGPWVSVLESLFDAGLYLECTFPVRSDSSKGDEKVAFGAEKVEYDVIHVCRKRISDPEPISWARLRRHIMRDVRQLQDILEQHQEAGLQEGDIKVIRRGKALEYFSRHYGKVYIEKGRENEFTVKDALAGINQILDDESDTTNEPPPILAEPFTRQFLRLFADKTSEERGQLQMHLRSTGISPSDFVSRGWCSEKKKIVTMMHPLEIAREWKGQSRSGMARDFDQAMFLVGACYENSGIRVQDTLNSQKFIPHPATGDLLEWFSRHGGDEDMKNAAGMAKQIYKTWQAKNKPKVEEQRTLFDLNDED